jgi:hypothetical protein
MNKLESMILALAIPAAIAAKAEASNVKCVTSLEEGVKPYVAANMFYQMPSGIDGFTFVNFSEGGYYGKTTLKKQIDEGISVRGQTVHANEPITQTGVGIGAVVPGLPKNTFLEVNYMPAWFDENGLVEDQAQAGYFVSVNLPAGIQLSSFGDWNVTGLNPKWMYGEVEVSKKFGPVSVSYNGALIGDGDATPDIEHRVAVAAEF